MSKLWLSFLLFIIALFCACSVPSIAGGGSSQQGNGIISGTARAENGLPAAGASVRVRPYDYLPTASISGIKGKVFDATTDSIGHFVISGVGQDNFTIEIDDRVSSAVAIEVAVAHRDTTIELGNRFLRPYAGISGIVDTAGQDKRLFIVQVRGLERAVQAGADGRFLLSNLPEGSFDLHVQPADSSQPPAEVLRVNTASGVTTPVAISAGWRYARQVFLNTAPGGADVAGTAVGFPVCIRLTDNSFSFDQALSGGRDLRFTKSDGTPLPYEIESWDSAAGVAVIWVRADTVYGNNGTQSMMMYWGAATGSATASLSDGAAVFSTAAGFQGVWHLGDRTGTSVDATVNNYSGTYAGSLPRYVPGAIGAGQSFDGSGDYANMGSVLDVGSNSFSISAWVKRGNAATVQAIAGKSNGGPPSAAYGYSFAFYPADTLNIAVASGGTVFGDTGSFRVKSNIAITDTAGWHYVVAVIDRSNSARCRLFIDGIDRSGIVEGDITTVGALSNSLPFRLGEAANGNYPFAGSLDEVEIAYSVRSADWVKLCYMNQKGNDVLVVLK